MNSYERANSLFQERGCDFNRVFVEYVRSGYAYIEPDRILLGRPVLRHDLRWLHKEEFDLAQAWFVQFAVGPGCMEWFFSKMPFYLPFVAWQRTFKEASNPVRFHRTESIRRAIRFLT